MPKSFPGAPNLPNTEARAGLQQVSATPDPPETAPAAVDPPADAPVPLTDTELLRARDGLLAAFEACFAQLDDPKEWAGNAILLLGDFARMSTAMPTNVAAVLLEMSNVTAAERKAATEEEEAAVAKEQAADAAQAAREQADAAVREAREAAKAAAEQTEADAQAAASAAREE